MVRWKNSTKSAMCRIARLTEMKLCKEFPFSAFSFKAILLYCRVHFIAAALSFEPHIITRNALQTIASFMRGNNYDYVK